MKKIILFICLITLRVNAQEIDRIKEPQHYSTTHNLRREEIRNLIHKQPFVIDVVSDGEKSSGMGFFIEGEGLAMTSYHVVSGGESIMASIDGILYQVEIVGFDEVLDVAVLKVKNVQSHPVQLAKNDPSLQSKVIIPEKRSQMSGKVVQSLENSFIADVEIAQGASGSPVFCGDAICGVVTSFQKQTGNAIATKISKIAKNLEKMTAGENFKKKKFDFYVMDLQKYDAISLETGSHQKNLGVLITHSIDEKLQTWDIITALNTQKVSNVGDLQAITGGIYSNEEVTFTVMRGKETITVAIP